MAHVSSQKGPYVITAKGPDGLFQQTRMTASSAILLAQTLRDCGCVAVEVTDPKGNLVEPQNYQREAARNRSW
jgi:hypothetical protein